MNEALPLFSNLPMAEKAAWIKTNGQFLEAQDYYSFFIHVYQLNQEHVKLLYDFSGQLVGIESEQQSSRDSFLSSQLESSL
jgi:hypothetical protein